MVWMCVHVCSWMGLMCTHVFRHKICVCIHMYDTCIWGMCICACSDIGFMYAHIFGYQHVHACLDIRDMCKYLCS